MGICCSKKITRNQYQIAPNEEREIQSFSYKSSSDSLLEVVELKYNLLTYILLIEYMNLLENYKVETATVPFNKIYKQNFSSKDEFFNQTMYIEEFQNFIENKLLKIPEIYDMSGKNELLISIFKDGFLKVYKGLELKLNQHYNEKISDRIKKKNLIPLGILFCSSNNVSKVKLIFDLFKNDENLFCKSNEFDEFLLCDFLTASYCLINARKSVSDNNSAITKITNEEIAQMVNTSELKDNEHLVQIFNEKFFDKEGFNWEEFKNKFDNKEGFGWILSSKGIRNKLEENNI